MPMPIMIAILTAFVMAGGQLLFKLGTSSWHGDDAVGWIVSFLKNPFLVTAVFMYAVTILVWIYLLKTLPLSLAYPLTALSYAIVPVFSLFFLHEKMSWHTAVGAAVIILGVAISYAKGGGA